MKANKEEKDLKKAKIKFRIWIKKEILICKIQNLPGIVHLVTYIQMRKKIIYLHKNNIGQKLKKMITQKNQI